MVFDQMRDTIFKFKGVECPDLVEGQYYIYLLECSDMSIYCGSTCNLKKRLQRHLLGDAAYWTKIRLPIQLIYYEVYESLLLARRREKQIKGWNTSKKVKLIMGIWKKI